MTNEQEIVRSVFDAYIRDAKVTSTKKDRPTFDMLEEVKNRAIKALEQQPTDETIKYLECNDIDVQKFTEAMKRQPLQVIKPNTSDDCVSRTQAIEWIENLRQMDKCFGNYEDDYFPLSEVIDRLKSVPPVTPTQNWIPVSERLPEVGEKVLCQCQANIYDVLKLTADGWYYDNRHCYMSGFVIAWQPLPKPYEEKRGSENEVN